MHGEATALTGHGHVRQSRVLEVLAQALPGADADTISSVADLVQPVVLAGGECLVRQGEPGDALYVVESGRLRVFNEAADSAHEVHVTEIGRGELVGEAALVDGAPRGASVYAIRDSRLLRLDKTAYETMLARDPRLGLQLARVALGRVRRGPRDRSRPVCFTLVAAAPGVDVHGLARALADVWGEGALVVTEGVAEDAEEARSSHVLHVVGEQWDDRSRRALRTADRILLVADARTDPAPRNGEVELWQQLSRQHDAQVSLALIHPAGTTMPSGTAAWLEARPGLVSHHHVRDGDARTVARLARLLDGSATSLVLGGGGARGFAHLGVVQVLEELEHPVDMVGGTSIGAVMATGVGMGLPAHEGREIAARAFRRLLDFTVPVSSVISGRRITRSLRAMYGDIDISDLWVPYFCVST
ncbi:MAG TPA: cyclic nucleotide-binding and patatin-like phospholipase domain-containing protein, partial [Nocardioidaceae bacterium]|nr:cyclic nucleotide-binding and patatin-like phospholipase domain-containing protein [Nocardioidaceae bacterium]